MIFPQQITPLIVPGCVLWLDANDPSANGIMPANNASMSAWNDKSGQKFNFTQGTGSRQPTYIRSAIGNNSALSFDGSSDCVINSSFTNFLSRTTSSTILVAFKSNLASGVAGALVSSYVSSSDRLTLMRGASNTLGMYKFDGTSYTGANTSFTDTNLAHIDVGICNAGTLSSYVDNVLSLDTDDNANTGGTVQTVIGARNGQAGAFFAGYIMEVIIYSMVISPTARSLLTNYLANRWGVAVS